MTGSGTTAAALSEVLKHDLARHAQACHKLLDWYLPGIAPFIEATRERFGGLDPRVSWKLLELAQYLERLQPRVVVEFGTGLTTWVQARWAVASGARVHAIEESPEHIDFVRDHLAASAGAVDFVHAASERIDVDGDLSCRYQRQGLILGEVAAVDLVYVDGPDNRATGHPGGLVCRDVIEMCQAGPLVREILFDLRLPTAHALARSPVGLRYDHHWTTGGDPFGAWPFWGERRYHTWFSLRSDGPSLA